MYVEQFEQSYRFPRLWRGNNIILDVFAIVDSGKDNVDHYYEHFNNLAARMAISLYLSITINECKLTGLIDTGVSANFCQLKFDQRLGAEVPPFFEARSVFVGDGRRLQLHGTISLQFLINVKLRT